jgi:hypothetical protein
MFDSQDGNEGSFKGFKENLKIISNTLIDEIALEKEKARLTNRRTNASPTPPSRLSVLSSANKK